MVLRRILGLMDMHLSVKAAFDEAVDQVDEIISTLEIDGTVKAASSMNRAGYSILVEDSTVQALAREMMLPR